MSVVLCVGAQCLSWEQGAAWRGVAATVMRSHESNSVFGYAQSIQIASDFNR